MTQQMNPREENVFQKLQNARIMFLDAGVCKSGHNLELDFWYYELNDIVPVAERIFQTLGLVSLISFTNETATADVVNVDKPEEVVSFASPMPEIQQMGGNALQSLGSAETYQRRYLWMMILDICEPDHVDCNSKTSKPQKAAEAKKDKYITNEQKDQIWADAVAAGIDEERFTAWAQKKFGTVLLLTRKDAEACYQVINQKRLAQRSQ